MGCTESIPFSENDFHVAHQVDPAIPILGGLPPSSKKVKLLVDQELFSWSGHDFKIKRLGGAPFHNIKIQGKAFAMADQMALVDANNKLIAVCLRKFSFGAQNFKIYIPQPLYDGQKKSANDYQGQRLYAFAEVAREAFSNIQKATYDGQQSPAFTVSLTSFWPRRRVVKCRGVIAATIERASQMIGNFYNLTICPGIDPCLIICLTAICDAMDKADT